MRTGSRSTSTSICAGILLAAACSTTTAENGDAGDPFAPCPRGACTTSYPSECREESCCGGNVCKCIDGMVRCRCEFGTFEQGTSCERPDASGLDDVRAEPVDGSTTEANDAANGSNRSDATATDAPPG
jgi:hypothetical protein